MMDAWIELMRGGEFRAAWNLSDAALRERAGVPCWRLPRHRQWVWDGSPLEGRRVLVRCYHGLGDTIMFIRYARLVRRVAREVIVWAPPRLLPVLLGVAGIDRLEPLHDGAPDFDYDVDVELLELPHVFRTTLETIPGDVPYLDVEPEPLGPGARARVGIAWRSADWNPARTIPFTVIRKLLEIPDIDFYSLQKNVGPDEVDGRLLQPAVEDVVKTARTIRALDRVVTVDAMQAHLAGALGVRVWTMLPTEADWRWMKDREDSPWYPTMRLFRQQRDGDWGPVVDRVAAELRASFCRFPASAPSNVV